ncbi:MAG: GxxExxY protein [Sphingobacteriales bacterium]|nr:MAG: GxxExxY protein [Sphingobacteriales bacterium]
MTQNQKPKDFPFKEECLELVECAFEIHKQLGSGSPALVYRNAFESVLQHNGLPYTRDKKYAVNYNGMALDHKFHADFLVNDGIIVEIKSCPFMLLSTDLDVFNQLILSKPAICLIINFNAELLQFKKVILV